jgi:hypothetical protein
MISWSIVDLLVPIWYDMGTNISMIDPIHEQGGCRLGSRRTMASRCVSRLGECSSCLARGESVTTHQYSSERAQ